MTSPLPLLDLFSGIGGFSLGLERSGACRTVAHCEIAPLQRRILERHWPQVPIYDDIYTLTATRLAADGIRVRAISGGFPCQPFSTASRGRRVARDLWPEMFRLVRECEPEVVVAENVAEAPIAHAAECLRGLGYRTDYRCISAAHAGADHQRDRWWLLAHPYAESELHCALNAEVAELPQVCRSLWGAANYARAIRVPDGLPGRLDRRRIEALGNAVLPQIPEMIGRAIIIARAAA